MLPMLCLALCAPVAAERAPREFVLDNGLRVIVQEDHRAPVVVSQVWYKVGSSYEHDGITGVSHALEHMMFKGTKRYGPREFSRLIAENGGEENAFTAPDYTAYHQKLEKSKLSLSFELEADRMRGLDLREREFAKEMKVVMEERRLRIDDNPEALTAETAVSAAYQSSPYRHPVIGWMADLEHLSAADLRAWYGRWYAPDNAAVVVVGDVDPEHVYRLARRYFGPLHGGRSTPPKPGRERPQRGMKRLTVRVAAKLPYLLMAYKAPSLKTVMESRGSTLEWEVYALEVLTGILDGGDSARLNRRVVREQQIAARAGAEYSLLSRLDSLLMLDGVPAQGHSVEALEAALREELGQLRNHRVEPRELQRVKAQVTANYVYQRDSLFYQAMQLGELFAVGLDWRLRPQYVDRIKTVTAEQVQAVARKYLLDDALTVATLVPLGAGVAQERD